MQSSLIKRKHQNLLTSSCTSRRIMSNLKNVNNCNKISKKPKVFQKNADIKSIRGFKKENS